MASSTASLGAGPALAPPAHAGTLPAPPRAPALPSSSVRWLPPRSPPTACELTAGTLRHRPKAAAPLGDGGPPLAAPEPSVTRSPAPRLPRLGQGHRHRPSALSLPLCSSPSTPSVVQQADAERCCSAGAPLSLCSALDAHHGRALLHRDSGRDAPADCELAVWDPPWAAARTCPASPGRPTPTAGTPRCSAPPRPPPPPRRGPTTTAPDISVVSLARCFFLPFDVAGTQNAFFVWVLRWSSSFAN